MTDKVIALGNSEVFDLTLSLDTNAYADGDVLAAPQEIPNFFRDAGAKAFVTSVVVVDGDDQGVAFDVVFLKSNTALGNENSAVNISAANAKAAILGSVSIVSDDYKDMINTQIANKTDGDLPLLLKAATNSRSIWVGAVSRGTGIYTASGIVLRIGVIRD